MTAGPAAAVHLSLLRLGPGEPVIEALQSHVRALGARSAVVASAVGSLAHLSYAVAERDDRGVVGYGPPIKLDEPLEITALQGHVGWEDDERTAVHFHGVVARPDGTMVGGHVFAAETLITVEIGLLVSDRIAWRRDRQSQPGGPPLPILLPEPVNEPGAPGGREGR